LRPSTERLRYEADETVDLAVLNRNRVFVIDQVTAQHRLQALSAVGASLPAHCTAIGKALLAGLTDEQVERLLPKRLPAETANTITDRDELLADLARVRVSRVAYDREELMIGILTFGAGIRDASGGVAELSIPVPTARVVGQEERLAEMLLRTCAEISATQGANVVHNRSGFGLIAEYWNEVSHVVGPFSTRPARRVL